MRNFPRLKTTGNIWSLPEWHRNTSGLLPFPVHSKKPLFAEEFYWKRINSFSWTCLRWTPPPLCAAAPRSYTCSRRSRAVPCNTPRRFSSCRSFPQGRRCTRSCSPSSGSNSLLLPPPQGCSPAAPSRSLASASAAARTDTPFPRAPPRTRSALADRTAVWITAATAAAVPSPAGTWFS